MAIKVLLAIVTIAFAVTGIVMGILNQKRDKKMGMIFIAVGLGCLACFMFLPWNIRVVNAGEVAVVKVWGEAREVRTASTYWDNMLTKKYAYYDSTVQQIDIRTEAYSSDGQALKIAMTVQWRIQPDKAINIINNYGELLVLSNRIEAVATERAKAILSTNQAMKIIETRALISPAIEVSVHNAITNDYYADIMTVVLTDISFSSAFEETVENKMIAEQEELRAEYEKQKAIIEAERDLEVAKLNAESAIAKAEGDAAAKLAIARADAGAIKLKSIEIARMFGFSIIESELDDDVIKYDIDFNGKTAEEIALISDYLKYITYLETWDGTLPHTLVTDDAASIIINP
ncbi:MAG: hypothetical protein EOM87_07530 [Clostridia bacterium]|nr:hypothetical protein [Clostridia bacterium]